MSSPFYASHRLVLGQVHPRFLKFLCDGVYSAIATIQEKLLSRNIIKTMTSSTDWRDRQCATLVGKLINNKMIFCYLDHCFMFPDQLNDMSASFRLPITRTVSVCNCADKLFDDTSFQALPS